MDLALFFANLSYALSMEITENAPWIARLLRLKMDELEAM